MINGYSGCFLKLQKITLIFILEDSLLQHHVRPGWFIVVLLSQFSGDEGCRRGLAALAGALRNPTGTSTDPRRFGFILNQACVLFTDIHHDGHGLTSGGVLDSSRLTGHLLGARSAGLVPVIGVI